MADPEDKRFREEVRRSLREIITEERRMPIASPSQHVTETVIRSGPAEEVRKLSMVSYYCCQCCQEPPRAWCTAFEEGELGADYLDKLEQLAKAAGTTPEQLIQDYEREIRIAMLQSKIDEKFGGLFMKRE